MSSASEESTTRAEVADDVAQETEEQFTPEKLADMCGKCAGRCCKYYTVMLDDPEDAEDYDEMRWFLAHGDNYIYIDEGEWHLNIEARCRFLDDDARCKIYDHRPAVCRNFGHDEECEYDGEYDFEKVFKTIHELEAHAREVLAPEEFAKIPVFPEGYSGPS
jgi:Fe-S-cluster containining protein